jgi:glutathione-regulated potassium-efflux system ancillary protein KefG
MPPQTSSDKKILILFAHPALQKSRIHAELLKNIPSSITLHDLYEEYPNMDIDVAKEQKLLTDHDTIVFQFPLYWYSTPAIIKEWLDLVLTHSWAYGSNAHALENKIWINALSSSGSREVYQPDGEKGHTIRELLCPLELTAKLCKMKYLPPFVIHGSHVLSDLEVNEKSIQYSKFLSSLENESFDLNLLSDTNALYSNEKEA